MTGSTSIADVPHVRLWQGVAAIAVVVPLTLVGGSARGSYSIPASGWSKAAASVRVALPPAPPRLETNKLAAEAALRINSAIPVASAPNPAARAFSMAGASASTRARALDCLTEAIYYEAATEGADGQRAVAQVVLNRVQHPAFPASVCGVVYQGSTRPGCQFTFACDGSLMRGRDRYHWDRAREIAKAALDGAVFAPAGTATFYHANYVVPVWAASLLKNAAIGLHSFYRWKGAWGTPSAFTEPYAGTEPDDDSLKRAALAAFTARAVNAATAEAGTAPNGSKGSLVQQLASVELKLTAASESLGAKNPTRIELEKKHAALVRRVPQASAVQLAAVEAEIAQASKTLGPKHPQMIALEERRAELLRKR